MRSHVKSGYYTSELRRLELECLQELYGDQRIDAELMTRVTVDQFYGIEYEEFPALIAEVAMWMADHIANNEINEAFRLNYARIPLSGGATIRHGDALEVDWNEVLPAEKCSFVMGNPPFVGAKFQTAEQRAQVRRIANLGGSGGTLDYVAAWFLKAGEYIQANKRIRIAFVSTNSITQGEQVAQLWPLLFDRYGLEIAFAHRTFSWGSEARGKAHVHVVIVGLTHRDFEPKEKRLFSYPDIKGDPVESKHGGLTVYLFDSGSATNRHLVVKSASRPLGKAPPLMIGSKPVDGGYLIFTTHEMSELFECDPSAVRFLRPFLGAHEFLNGGKRYIIDVERIIKQLPIPLFVHIMHVIWRNVLILGHNILILPVVLVVIGKEISFIALLAIPGGLLVIFFELDCSVVCYFVRSLSRFTTSC